MPETLPPDSVGLVTPQTMTYNDPLEQVFGACMQRLAREVGA